METNKNCRNPFHAGVYAALAMLSAVLAMLALAESATAKSSEPSQPRSPAEVPRLERADLESWLDGLVPHALEQANIAGVVIAVVKDGRTLLQKGYGYADVAEQIPMDPQRTIVEVASVSKTFTWTAVMQLVEQGKLDLDRDVNDYLDFKIPPAFGKAITLRNLMTHTAGFEERLKLYPGSNGAPRSLAAYLHAVPSPQRIYPPGTVQAYSNYGALISGYIVERLSGEEFPEYVRRHILEPLGMARSTFLRPVPEVLRKDLARNYPLASDDAYPTEPSELTADPAGSLVSTASDMSRFMRAHLQSGSFEAARILEAHTANLMHTSAFMPMSGAQETALGFFHADYNGHRIIVHDGDGSGNHTDMQLLLDDGVGFFSSFNSDGTGSFIGAAYALRASILHHFMDRYFPALPERSEPTVATAKEHARTVAGEYEMSRRPSGDFMKAMYLAARVAIVANEDGTIQTSPLLNFKRGLPQTWREVGPFSWQEIGGRARLNMKVENGKVAAWLPGDLTTFVLEPVPFIWSAALNLPLLACSGVVLFSATLLWPVAAMVRRRYGRKLHLEGRAGVSYRLTRLAALAGCAFLLSWVLLIVVGGSAGFDPSLDPWIRLIQLIGLVCAGGAAIAIWNAWITCSEQRSAWAEIWSLLLALALADLVWFSFAFNLVSVDLNY